MTTALVPIKRPPSSTHWNMAGVRGPLEFWRARSGKLFANDPKTGRWWKVVSKAACGHPAGEEA